MTLPRYCFDIRKCRDIDNPKDKKQRDSHGSYAGANCETQKIDKVGFRETRVFGKSADMSLGLWVGLVDKDGPRDLSEFRA